MAVGVFIKQFTCTSFNSLYININTITIRDQIMYNLKQMNNSEICMNQFKN